MKGHDPLCIVSTLDPKAYDHEERVYYECYCALIASAREDERRSLVVSILDGTARLEGRPIGFIEDALAAAVQRVEALIDPDSREFNDGLFAAIAAIKGESA